MYPCITTYWLNQPIIFIVIASYIVNVVNINYFNAYIWSEYIQVTIIELKQSIYLIVHYLIRFISK